MDPGAEMWLSGEVVSLFCRFQLVFDVAQVPISSRLKSDNNWVSKSTSRLSHSQPRIFQEASRLYSRSHPISLSSTQYSPDYSHAPGGTCSTST
jgi:hypothetical protein